MAVTDPVDARLLSALAEVGKVAVHELAARVGMDPRDVAYRLVGLSAQGLPLLVGVESDPGGLRSALAASNAVGTGPLARPHGGAPGVTSGSPPPGPATGGTQPVHGTPSGAYPVHGTPSGSYPVHGTPSGAYAVGGVPTGPYPPPHPAPNPPQNPQQHPQHPPLASPARSGAAPAATQHAPPPDPAISTWGPPQSAQWARGDQQPPLGAAPAPVRRGRAGDSLATTGLEGEQLTVQLLEVQDPADFLFSAAGYSLRDGERAVVVHTEITNRGSVPYASLPDNYLELLAADGSAIAKAPVSLTSRPPHKIGVRPGETTGGHTVYVVADAVRLAAVRWSPRPEPDERSLTWVLDDAAGG
ncbi:AsnC family protein [Saccharomonospora piscinae]|uniref:AsnC family protein n=1 Tax=Saccharomonospora piscinae TaxID=687388 RepID=UPI000465ADC7|nr:AsnC family protein [Saccharomonospora piscinae]